MSLTPEQLALRAEAYGASEVATIVGVGPGKLVDLWESKVNPAAAAEDPDDENLLSDLGHMLEDPVAQVYARRTKSSLARVGTIRHPTKPLAIATPDRARFAVAAPAGVITDRAHLADAERLVEVKTTGGRYRRDYGEAGSGVVPDEKALQVTWQMGVCGGPTVTDMPVLFRSEWGVRIETFTVMFNEGLFESVYEAVEKFHREYVVPRRPPPPDASDAWSEVIGRIYPAAVKPHAVADSDDEELILRWAKFREVERRARVLKELAGQRLMQRIRDAGGLVSPTLGKMSWIHVRDRTDVDWKKAANSALALAGLCLQGFDTLKKVGEQLSDENRAQLEARLKAILPESSKPAGGYRYLKLYPRGAAALELARLEVALDALGDGEE